jgi:hypothetical protein
MLSRMLILVWKGWCGGFGGGSRGYDCVISLNWLDQYELFST